MTRSGAGGRSSRRLRSWLPTAMVAVACLGFVIAAFAMGNSWWLDPERGPSADQQAPDGMSFFSGAGVDYFTRQGVVKIDMRADSTAASELGLDPDGARTVEPLVPIAAVVLGEEGPFRLELVNTITVHTASDRVRSVELGAETNGSWNTAYAQIARVAPTWGWTDADLDAFVQRLTEGSRSAGDAPYSAELPEVAVNGALVSARIVVNVAASQVDASFTISND